MTGFPLREDLVGLAAYKAPQKVEGIRLNTNESPLPPPPAFDAALRRRLESIGLNRYPDRDANELRARLSAAAGWTLDGTWVANGSNEILQTLLLSFGGPGRKLLLFPPTYAMYTHLARVSGTEVVTQPVAEPWELSPEMVSVAIERHDPDLVIICSPNNPTGTVASSQTLAAAAESARGLVLVDQAYFEFGQSDARALLDGHERLVLVRSFSKSWQLAGARIGFLLAHPWLVSAIQVARLPYHLSSLAQAAGLAALDVADEILATADLMSRNRDLLTDSLREIDGVEVFRSGANFVLFRTPRDATELFEQMASKGVIVRDVSSAIPRALRVTASTEEEQAAFLRVLKECL